MLKTCRECKVEKELEQFYKDAKTPGGYRHNCKECKNKKTVIWREANREHYNATARVHHKKNYQRFRLNRYGITPEEHADKLASQGNKCGICGKFNKSTKRSLATDHNHSTGKFRGVLCYKCNRDMNVLDDAEQLARCLAFKKATEAA